MCLGGVVMIDVVVMFACIRSSLVYVEGALSTRTYKDATGAEKTICEIILPKYKGDLNVLSKREGQDEEAHEVEHHELVEDKENVTLA